MTKGTVLGARPRVVLYGNSMFLAGIRANLACLTSLKLITVAADSPEAAVLVDSHNPLALLFDLASDRPAFAVDLLHKHPGMLLIGVDSSSDEMLILSSHPTVALNMSDLVNIIHQKLSRS